ncbi:MAG: Gfo/Idh/MocA family oxidoreductase [Litorilinea sp.]
MSTPLRAGLVGCGSLSQRGVLPHLTQADAQDNVKLVAVADVVEARARETAQHFKIPAHFTTIEEMLDGADIDIALIITPIPFHHPNALAAIRAGKHVYIQKAMTTTVAEADELIAEATAANVKIAAAPGFELFPSTAHMRDAIRNLGRVCVGHTYTMGFGHEFEPIRGGEGALAEINPAWYYRAGAGPLPDVTIYSLQLITSLLGPVRRVTALSNKVQAQRTWRGETIDVEVDDNNLVLMEFQSGALVTAVGANCRGSRRIPWGGVGLYGTDGTLEILDVDHASGYPTAYEVTTDKAQEYTFDLDAQPWLRAEHLNIEEPHVYADIMDLAAAIREDRAPIASAEQARHVVEIIEAARAASASGATQTLQTTFATPATES